MNKVDKLLPDETRDERYGDAEYAAWIDLFVLPMIREWKPELIIVSSGFDAAMGDPYGLMDVTPPGYYYMTGKLAEQKIPLVVLLEGGYNFHSMGLSAVGVMTGLIERKPPTVLLGWSPPKASFMHTLLAAMEHNKAECHFFVLWLDLINAIRNTADLQGIVAPTDADEEFNKEEAEERDRDFEAKMHHLGPKYQELLDKYNEIKKGKEAEMNEIVNNFSTNSQEKHLFKINPITHKGNVYVDVTVGTATHQIQPPKPTESKDIVNALELLHHGLFDHQPITRAHQKVNFAKLSTEATKALGTFIKGVDQLKALTLFPNEDNNVKKPIV